MPSSVEEMARLGGWVMGGHIPPFPPGEAPPEPHGDDCALCGENEFRRRQAAARGAGKGEG